LQRWQFHKADWAQVKHLCLTELNQINYLTTEDPVNVFTCVLHSIASRTIPKSSPIYSSRCKPWFDEECKQAINNRNRAYRLLCHYPTPENLIDFRKYQAQTRRLIKSKKKISWKNYVSGLTSKTPIKKTWDMVRKITGKPCEPQMHHLQNNDTIIEDPVEIVNTLGKSIATHSSLANCSDLFLSHKTRIEKNRLNFNSVNEETYNSVFSLRELDSAIAEARNTSPGPDDIPYQLLKELPSSSLQVLLDIFNYFWVNNKFPNCWREAMVIPIPKLGKDRSNAANYRPIALTSCICKTMERMINKRLTWFLEYHNLINPIQSGFRQGRSTTDHLVRLETFIRDAFISKQHAVAIFFDLEKAYDTTWRYGIMKDLHDMGFRGNLPLFIENFLQHRSFQIRVGTTVSQRYNQEIGVPQGSILSVTLFNVKINNIVKCLSQGIQCSLYVDDFVICYRSAYIPVMERALQNTINKLQVWTHENGFHISRSKTVAVHFSNLRSSHRDPELFLYDSPIKLVNQNKFLGVIFDRKLSFVPHIKELKKKCLKALNILKVVGHYDWGADRKTLLALYHALIRSKLDYGCIVYGSARSSYRKILDPVQNQALRICLGAFRTSPAIAIHVEANELSLDRRREQLAAQYVLKIKTDHKNMKIPTISALWVFAWNCSLKPLKMK